VKLDLRDAFHGRVTVQEVTLKSVDFRVPMGSRPGESGTVPFRFSLREGTIRRTSQQLELDLTGQAFDAVRCRISGTVDLAGWKKKELREPLDIQIAKFLDEARPSMDSIRRILDRIDWGEEAEAVLTLNGVRPTLSGLCLSFSLTGRNGLVDGQVLDRWSLKMDCREGRIAPVEGLFECGGDAMALQGWVDLVHRRLDLSAQGQWNSATVLRRVRSWIPKESARPPDAVLRGAARMEIHTGDVAWSNVTEKVSGRVQIEEPAELYGVPFSRLDLEARREGMRMRLNVRELDLGWIAGANRLSGSGFYHLDTREFSGKAEGTGQPAQILALLTPSEVYIMGGIRFLGEAPRLSVDFLGQIGDISKLELTGQVAGRDFVYQGTAVDEASFDISIREQVVYFTRMVVKRPEGALTGFVTLFYREGRVEFEVDSRISPEAAARILGPIPHRFIQKFRIEGPASVVGKGWLMYRRPVSGDLRIEVVSEKTGMDWALADRIAFTATLKGQRLSLRDLSGSAYGGSFSGEAWIEWPDDPEIKPTYSLCGTLDKADLKRILNDIQPGRKDTFEGAVTLQADLTGQIGVGTGATVSGTGSCKIQGERLLSLPLMGGLSRFLARLSPGFGYLSQSEMRADCQVKDSRILTRNLILSGPVLSMRARGTLGFNLSLQFVVEAQLLRRGPVASTVRVLTLPLTRLLEFELKGTVSEPQWNPKNIPGDPFLSPETAPDK
jgi:hypothetical protein